MLGAGFGFGFLIIVRPSLPFNILLIKVFILTLPLPVTNFFLMVLNKLVPACLAPTPAPKTTPTSLAVLSLWKTFFTPFLLYVVSVIVLGFFLVNPRRDKAASDRNGNPPIPPLCFDFRSVSASSPN